MPNIILIGFSGTGKTAVGREVARLLAWNFVDTDTEVVQRAGKSIEAIFSQDGEPAFRRLERDSLAEACVHQRTVIATGGGPMMDPANRGLLRRSGVVVCLEAAPETILARLSAQQDGAQDEDGTLVRPLVAGPDPLNRVTELKAFRQAVYAQAHWTVHTDNLTVAEAAAEVVRAWDRLHRRLPSREPASGAAPDGGEPAAVVHSSAGPCPIYVGWGILSNLGEWCRRAGLVSTAFLLSDETVYPRHGLAVQRALEEVGILVHAFSIPAGEPSKALATAAKCYDWLAGHRAERRDFLVAVGGGVVGDLGGFVAATFNRGMPFLQVPTSLAAMVDASIGGKTAVNLAAGKNLVGAFHQPRLVLADVQTLTTLPKRELASGWAEAIKHGLILDADLFDTFEGHAEAIAGLEQPLVTEVLRRSMSVKAGVVTQDERETLGVRTLLNYGHTIGHALETATAYGALLHGEAVAVGMAAAARISQGMGLLGPGDVDRQDHLLSRFGLPTRFSDVDRDAVHLAMQVDKKVAAGAINWVLLHGVGRAVIRSDVPAELVGAALQEVTPSA